MADFDKDAEGADDGDDNGPAVVSCFLAFFTICNLCFMQQEESTATFTPVVQLEAVEVKTHEEDEDVIFKQ